MRKKERYTPSPKKYMYKDLQIISTKCDSNDAPLGCFLSVQARRRGIPPSPKKYMYKDLQIISTKCDSNEHE